MAGEQEDQEAYRLAEFKRLMLCVWEGGDRWDTVLKETYDALSQSQSVVPIDWKLKVSNRGRHLTLLVRGEQGFELRIRAAQIAVILPEATSTGDPALAALRCVRDPDDPDPVSPERIYWELDPESELA